MLLVLPRYCSASEMIASAKTDFYAKEGSVYIASLMRKVWASGNGILEALGQKHGSIIFTIVI